MTGTLTRICRAGLLSSFVLVSYFAVASSFTLDLTELRNKVSKIKLNPRGKLWAMGHFMGKKSVADGSIMDSAFENVPVEVRAARPLRTMEDLQALIILLLEAAQHARDNQDLKQLKEILIEEHLPASG